MVRVFNKDIFLKAVSCPTLGWLARHEELPDSSTTLRDEFLMEQGRIVGEKARELYPEGTLTSDDFGSALSETRDLMEREEPVIFEGAFAADSCATKADILEKTGDGWHMIEVKSGTNERETCTDDMAYTTMVIERSGHEVSKVSLMILSSDFRLGMGAEDLFERVERTEEVFDRVEEFRSQFEEIERVTAGEEKPEPELIRDCRDCEVFEECVGGDVDNPLFDLPYLGDRFEELAERGVERIEDVPDDFNLTRKQEMVRESVQSNEIDLDSKCPEPEALSPLCLEGIFRK